MRELLLHAYGCLERKGCREVGDLKNGGHAEEKGHRHCAVKKVFAEKALLIERIEERVRRGFVRNADLPPALEVLKTDRAFFSPEGFKRVAGSHADRVADLVEP